MHIFHTTFVIISSIILLMILGLACSVRNPRDVVLFILGLLIIGVFHVARELGPNNPG